jgi:hypothetical protein
LITNHINIAGSGAVCWKHAHEFGSLRAPLGQGGTKHFLYLLLVKQKKKGIKKSMNGNWITRVQTVIEELKTVELLLLRLMRIFSKENDFPCLR